MTPVPCGRRPPALTLGTRACLVARVRQGPAERSRRNRASRPTPQKQTGHSGPGAEAGARVTLDLDPGLGVTQGPDVHHHIHAAGRKVFVVWGPGQADDLCMVSIKDVVLLVAG